MHRSNRQLREGSFGALETMKSVKGAGMRQPVLMRCRKKTMRSFRPSHMKAVTMLWLEWLLKEG